MPEFTVRAVGRTHVGLVKPNNEDSFYIGDRLLLVADGVEPGGDPDHHHGPRDGRRIHRHHFHRAHQPLHHGME